MPSSSPSIHPVQQLKEEPSSPAASVNQPEGIMQLQPAEEHQGSPADTGTSTCSTLAYPQPSYPSQLQTSIPLSPQDVAGTLEPISPVGSTQVQYASEAGYHTSAFHPVRPQSKSPINYDNQTYQPPSQQIEVSNSSSYEFPNQSSIQQSYEHLKQASPVPYEASPDYQRTSPSYPSMLQSYHESQQSVYWYQNASQPMYEYQQQAYQQHYPAAQVQQYYQQQLSPEMSLSGQYPAGNYQAYTNTSPNSYWNQAAPSMTTPSPPTAYDAMIPSGLCSKCNKVACTCKVKLATKSRSAPLRCRKCRRGFSYSKRLIEHELACTVQPPYNPAYDGQDQIEVTDLECDGCHKTFKSIRWLEWHKVNKCEVLSSGSPLQSDTSSQSSDLGYQSSSPTQQDMYSPWNSQSISGTSPTTSIQSSEMTTSPWNSQPAAEKTRRGRKPKVYRRFSPSSPSSPVSSSDSDNEFPSYMKDGKYCCGLCNSAFSFDTNLTRHHRNIHGKKTVRKSRTTSLSSA